MKSILLIFTVLIILSGCNKKQHHSSKSVEIKKEYLSDQDKREIKQEVFERVKYFYSYDKSAWNEDNTSCEFWSSELNEVYGRATKQCREEGYIDPVDYDPWLQCQDSENPKIDINGISVINESRASALIIIRDMGHTNRLKLMLVKENSSWVVDDFITEGKDQAYSLKANLKTY